MTEQTSGTAAEPEIRRNDDAGRYEAVLDGEVAGFAEFARAGDSVVFPHTVVPPQFEGRGIAGRIVRFALDDVRAQGGLSVVPACSYVAAWIDRYPEYADLVAQRS